MLIGILRTKAAVMAHYGYITRRVPFRRAAAARPSSAAFLALKYGAALDQIKQVFLSLDDSRKEPVLRLYAQRYGLAAGLYARRAYRRWKSGDLPLGGPTLLRLLELLPSHMDDVEKLELIKRLRIESAKRARRANIRLKVRCPRDLAHAVQIIAGIKLKASAEPMISSFEELSSWLATEDLHGFQSLAEESERQACGDCILDLFVRLASLSELRKLDAKRVNTRVALTFEIPTVTATVNFASSYWRTMESDDDLLVRLQELALKQEHQGGGLSYVDYVMRTLTPDEQTKLRAIAAAEGLKTEILLKELQVKTLAARGDIQSVIETAEQLKAKRHHSKISSEHATASGVTKIEIENRRRWSCGWVLLIIGSLAGLLGMLVAALLH